jgi:hypothetical protein
VAGLDGLLEGMQVSQFIAVERVGDRQVFRLGPQAPATDKAPPEDVNRARETLQAIDVLGEDRALVELEEILDESYELVS